MISLLCPTRARPKNVRRLIDSALSTADNPDNIEFVFYIDKDDNSYDHWLYGGHKIVRGPRIVLSEMWNKCHQIATGPYYYHMGDDIVFKTNGWDTEFLKVFDSYKDKVVFVWGDDKSPSASTFGTHGMIHENWVDVVGYFVPPYFSSDYNDTWLNEVAGRLGRKVFLPNVVTEHMHPDWGKAHLDITHKERIKRHKQDNVDKLYKDLAPQREADAKKLQQFIESFG